MRSLDIFISLYVVGMAVFCLQGIDLIPFWEKSFFLWQSVCEGSLLAWVTIYYVGDYYVKKKVYWIMWFAVVKLLWEVLSLVFNIHINDDKAIAIIFLLLIAVASYLTLRKEATPNKWLSKYLFKSD